MQYNIIHIEDFADWEKQSIYCEILHKKRDIITVKKSGKNKLKYIRLCSGFDIETTTTDTHNGYMYHWQMSIDDYVILGRRWSSFIELIDVIKKELHLSSDTRIIIWIANLGFEFQFLKLRFNITNLFARESRKPLYAIIDDCIELRDCLAITGGSLKDLAKDYTTTQKLVGDLDYSKPRSYKTFLTIQEENYCINDVAILSEFADYIFNSYIIPQKFVPLTKTGLLRREIKKGCNWNVAQEIYRCYPPTFDDYSYMMMWLFRGGYVHSNILLTDKILYDVSGYDITSSYPYVMFTSDMFPVSNMIPIEVDEVLPLLYDDDYCIMFKATFYNLRCTTSHSLESSSKCIDTGNHILIDNGRIRRGDITVYITDIDYKLYEMLYVWDEIKIHFAYKSKRGRLPKYVIEPIAHAYMKKSELKRQGLQGTPEYMQAKSFVNSGYGCTVTRLSISEHKIDDCGLWYQDHTSFNYEKERRKAFLLPQWGVYVTALARYNLLSTVYKIECNKKDSVIYCDTDSIKLLYPEMHKKIFDDYNKKAYDNVKAFCKRFNYDIEPFNDLGAFDLEYSNAKMKTLGAKRYITQIEDKIDVTVAGLPKNTLQDYCLKNNLDIFDVFSDNMILNSEVSLKNTVSYNDGYSEEWIDGVLMSELSSVGIYPIDFTMKVSSYYNILIKKLKEEALNYEDRIY